MAEFFNGYPLGYEDLLQAPLLTSKNSETFQHGTVCRYYGMVQNQLQPKWVVESFTTPDGGVHYTTLADIMSNQLQPDFEQYKDLFTAQAYFCVGLPGQSPWLQTSAGQGLDHHFADMNSSKRARTDDDIASSVKGSGTLSNGKGKVSKHQQLPPQSSDKALAQAKQAHGLDGPADRGCNIMVYHPDVELRLNDVVEVMGVYSLSPDLADEFASVGLAEGTMPFAETLAQQHPSSLVSELHCLRVRRINPYEMCRALPDPSLSQRIAALRTKAIDVLAVPLGGDRLAAEYLLLQLVSRVYTRAASKPLGVFSLSLQNCPEAAVAPDTLSSSAPDAGARASPTAAPLSCFGAAVKEAVASLVPACVALPLTVDMLNSEPLRPHTVRKTTTVDSLMTTPLQLAAHTQLLLDATLMQAGQLERRGIYNLQVLGTLMQQQEVEYEYAVYNLPLPSDVPVTILTMGKSLLHKAVDLELPLNTTGLISEAPVDDDSLPAIRAYLHQAQQLDFHIDVESASWINQELMDARQELGNSENSFHNQLTLGRLMAVSWGETSMTKERWYQMKAMERARLNRLNVTRPTATQNAEKVVAAYCG
ncbi:hypothetical protein ABBQ32_007935 [Trebouxia sp. C0010 RCD-2024]